MNRTNHHTYTHAQEKDKNFFFRLFLIIILFIAVLVNIVVFIKHVVFVPVYAKPLIPFKTKED